MYIIYKLTFDDATIYIGQTSDLNARLAAHKPVWKRKGLAITRVEVLHTPPTRARALALESACIKLHDWELSRNIGQGQHTEADALLVSDKLERDMDPTHPMYVARAIEMYESKTEQVAYITKKVRQLESRYIRTYFENETMTNNIKQMDKLIDEAIHGAL